MATRVRLLSLSLVGCLIAAAQATGSSVPSLPDSSSEPAVAPPAYEWAARAAGVPASVLFAVALQESGAFFRGRWIPWPWTLNIESIPRRFATQAEACAALTAALRRAARHRIDVGLAQINLGYFGRRVATPCGLLDPYRNLLLAASILRQHHRPDEDWMVAIGRYHRPAGGVAAEQYRESVATQLARVLENAGIAPTADLP